MWMYNREPGNKAEGEAETSTLFRPILLGIFLTGYIMEALEWYPTIVVFFRVMMNEVPSVSFPADMTS